MALEWTDSRGAYGEQAARDWISPAAEFNQDWFAIWNYARSVQIPPPTWRAHLCIYPGRTDPGPTSWRSPTKKILCLATRAARFCVFDLGLIDRASCTRHNLRMKALNLSRAT
eukprot:5237747-Amphidinium_carterae.1